MAYFDRTAGSGWDPRIADYHNNLVGAGRDAALEHEIDFYVRECKGDAMDYNPMTRQHYKRHDKLPIPDEVKRARLELAARKAGVFVGVEPDFYIDEYDTVQDVVMRIKDAMERGGRR